MSESDWFCDRDVFFVAVVMGLVVGVVFGIMLYPFIKPEGAILYVYFGDDDKVKLLVEDFDAARVFCDDLNGSFNVFVTVAQCRIKGGV